MDPTLDLIPAIRASLNIEKMPIVFLGSPEERKRIQLEIVKTGKPLVVYDGVVNGVGKRLCITPSSAYGLLTGFDMDVLTVVHHKLFELTKQTGSCPENLRLQLSEFPKVMKLQTTGDLYNRIKESVKRISEMSIYHENFVKVKETKTGETQTYKETSLKIFHYKGLYKEEREKAGNMKMRKLYIDIDIPEWLRSNIDNGYTTEFDPNIYFSISNDRAKRLYRVLEVIRYEEMVLVPLRKIDLELCLNNLEQKEKNRVLKRALEQLIKINFVASYSIIESYLSVTFKEFKKASLPFKMSSLPRALTAQEKGMTDWLVKELNDEHSRVYLSSIVAKVPEQIIDLCLSLTKETATFNGIKTTRAAVFVDHIKRECERRDIPLT